MVKRKYHSSVSVYYSLISFLKNPNTVLSGEDLFKTLNRINEQRTEKMTIPASVVNIENILNADGVINLQTQNKKPVFINQLMLEDKAKMKIQYSTTSNARIDVLNGFKIGTGINWNEINFIVLDKKSGEVIFDYENHYRKSMPVRSQVL
ncbi:MAG: hypothetical protein HC906_15185 [Bacteroidales bacterium]|nr:hypothetical protein [Bacteroidales bacterium]